MKFFISVIMSMTFLLAAVDSNTTSMKELSILKGYEIK